MRPPSITTLLQVSAVHLSRAPLMPMGIPAVKILPAYGAVVNYKYSKRNLHGYVIRGKKERNNGRIQANQDNKSPTKT